MKKLEHIGIAVKDLIGSVPLFEALLNTPCYKTELVESEKVKTAFFLKGDTKIELLESTHPEGVISRFISNKGEGLHHIAFEVENLHAEVQRLQLEGFTVIEPFPKLGADNKLVCFLHPRSTNGILVELCQENT